MKEKRTEVITFRTEKWVKDLLTQAAEENKWSIAQLVNELCKMFITNPHPNEITIKTKNLSDLVKELEEESNGIETATKIYIDINADEEKMDIYKTLSAELLQAGGHGSCIDFENNWIKELTEEELLDIP